MIPVRMVGRSVTDHRVSRDIKKARALRPGFFALCNPDQVLTCTPELSVTVILPPEGTHPS